MIALAKSIGENEMNSYALLHDPAAPAVRAMDAIVARYGWSLTRLGLNVEPRFAHHVHVADAELLLLATAQPLEMAAASIDEAMRATRSDALVLSHREASPSGVEIALGIWGESGNRWHAPMTLWLDAADMWIVPDPYHPYLRNECFELRSRRLRRGSAPWISPAEERAGRAQARIWITRALER